MRRVLARKIVVLTLLALLAGSASACSTKPVHTLAEGRLSGPRILVIAPHPDDETVGVGAAIAEARSRGIRVTVVFVTCGDGFTAAVRRRTDPVPTPAQMQAFGTLRAEEARRATEALGVPAGDVIFLGFPDGSTHFLWGTNFSGPPLRGRNGATAVPYAFAYRPRAAYTGSELQSELEQIVLKVKPTTVLMPDAADVHRDHWAAEAFTEAALMRTGYTGSSLAYLVHRTGFPNPRGYLVSEPMNPPASLRRTDESWLSLPVTDADCLAQARALAVYGSQLRSDGRLVRSFVRSDTLLAMQRVPSLGRGSVVLLEGSQDPAFRGARPSGTIDAISVSRSATAAAVTLNTAATVSPALTYVLHVRAYGPGATMRFYDAQIARGRFSAVREATESVAGTGRLLSFDGTSASVELPQELLSGARWLFVGADSYTADLTADHAPWRLVRLDPR